MYTGFKFIGIIGMFVGPIILIVLKNIFATFIDKGVVKSIFERWKKELSFSSFSYSRNLLLVGVNSVEDKYATYKNF